MSQCFPSFFSILTRISLEETTAPETLPLGVSDRIGSPLEDRSSPDFCWVFHMPRHTASTSQPQSVADPTWVGMLQSSQNH